VTIDVDQESAFRLIPRFLFFSCLLSFYGTFIVDYWSSGVSVFRCLYVTGIAFLQFCHHLQMSLLTYLLTYYQTLSFVSEEFCMFGLWEGLRVSA